VAHAEASAKKTLSIQIKSANFGLR